MSSLHDTDFYSWPQQQAALLKSGNIADLYIINLIDEIEDMGRSEKRELKSRLQMLLMHLLKWLYKSIRQGKRWYATINGQREGIAQCLLENPGLKPMINFNVTAAYRLARFDTMAKTGLDENMFPKACP